MKQISLGEFCHIQQGKTYKIKSLLPDAANCVPIYTGAGVLGYTNQVAYSGGVTILAAKGFAFGRVLWAKGPLCVDNNAIAVSSRTELGNKYLYRLMESLDLKKLGFGASQPIIRVSTLAQQQVFVHPESQWGPITEQIAQYDEEIEAKSRAIVELERNAQADFSNCFIGGRKARSTQNYISLADLGEYTNGIKGVKKYPATGFEDMPLLRMAQLNSRSLSGCDYVSRDVPEKFHIKAGSVILSWSGRVSVNLWDGPPAALNQHLFLVKSVKYPAWFLYFALKHFLEALALAADKKSATSGHLTRDQLATYHLPAPSEASIKRYAPQFATALVSRAQLLTQQDSWRAKKRDFIAQTFQRVT